VALKADASRRERSRRACSGACEFDADETGFGKEVNEAAVLAGGLG
jgi:hypothetical protein